MFLQADWIVKSVMIGLALASLATWTVLVAKTRELRALVKSQKQALGIVATANSLKAAHQQLEQQEGNTELTLAAARELQLSANTLSDVDGVKERVASSLGRLEAASGRRITRGTGILATIGATAPFVGLFGTVWGVKTGSASRGGDQLAHCWYMRTRVTTEGPAALTGFSNDTKLTPAMSAYRSSQRYVLILKASILGKLGLVEEAQPVIKQLVATNPDIKRTFYPWFLELSWARPVLAEIADGLAKAGLIVDID